MNKAADSRKDTAGGRKTENQVRFLIAAAFLLAVLAGCAEKGPILLSVGYQAPAEMPRAANTISAGVSPFTDGRAQAVSSVGKRTVPSGIENDLVIQGTAAELATIALKKALVARGIAVNDLPAWDLTMESMKAGDVPLLFGGVIKTLWLESTASTLTTHVTASVQLRIVVGDGIEKKLLRTVEVNSKIDQDILYSREKLESAFSEALSSAIDQIFKDEELKKRLP